MARSRNQAVSRSSEARSTSVVETVLTVLGMWLVPLSLFGYIGYSIAVATGHEPFEFVPAVSVWEVALFASVAVAALVGGVFAVRAQRRSERVNRWDDYQTPQA